jgi:diadenylate cyclase
MLPIAVINRIVDRFGHLPDLMTADAEDLVRVEGVGARRARAITTGLSRVRSHVAVV